MCSDVLFAGDADGSTAGMADMDMAKLLQDDDLGEDAHTLVEKLRWVGVHVRAGRQALLCNSTCGVRACCRRNGRSNEAHVFGWFGARLGADASTAAAAVPVCVFVAG